MKCINDNCEEKSIQKNDNFCPKCGHWTAKGYSLLNNDAGKIDGKITRKKSRTTYLFIFLFFIMFIFVGLSIYRGQNLLKPFVYLKRQAMNYKYGYNVTVLKTNNQYFNIKVNDETDALNIIKSDFDEQKWQCKNNYEVSHIEDNLEKNLNIAKVSFCDISIAESQKISDIIFKFYDIFPNIKGYLTNISISNSNDKSEYVAYFQPLYQFVNSTSNINEYNKVNKTQILLNSYYFLNDDILSSNVKKDLFVNDSTWESLIAHEFGHYITYVTLLKSKNINNLYFITKDNIDIYNEVMDIVNSGLYSKSIVDEAINNYNLNNNINTDISEFASGISNYAKSKIKNKESFYDELIAEAIHDYFLHGDSACKQSLEIVKIVKAKLG